MAAMSDRLPTESSRKNENNRTVLHNYCCQRCGQLLKLDSSLLGLDEAVITELSAPLLLSCDHEETLTFLPGDQMMDHTRKIIPPQRNDESSNGFMLVSDKDNGAKLVDGHDRNVLTRLFDVMSDHSYIDHPLCEDCTDIILDLMDEELKSTENECKQYRECLEQLLSKSDFENDEETKQLEEELQQLKIQEEELSVELAGVLAEKNALGTLLANQEKEAEALKQEENNYWREFCEHKRQVLLYDDEQRSVDNQLRYAQLQLDKFKKTNVFNLTFHIWHSGHFGTINNFRLGRLPSVPVDWSEINAGWGQAVLLLHALARKIGLTFQRYKLIPYGNHSYVQSLDEHGRELPLYGSGGFRFFWDTKFDQGMVAFLDCLQQFKDEVKKGDSSFSLPYKMDKGRIEDSGSGASYSVKIQFNSEEQWTKALKLMLTNMKWAIAWVSSQLSPSG